ARRRWSCIWRGTIRAIAIGSSDERGAHETNRVDVGARRGLRAREGGDTAGGGGNESGAAAGGGARARGSGGAAGQAVRRSRRLSSRGLDEERRGAALFRSRPQADVGLQSRRGAALVRSGGGARSVVRSLLLGRGDGA